MSRKNTRGRGSVHGEYVDGLAAVLTKAMHRLGQGEGSRGLLMASRPLSGPDDGGDAEIVCGSRENWPPTVSLLALNEEEQQVAHKIVAASLEDPAFDTWSDFVVAIKVQRAGVAVGAMARPASVLSDPADVRARNQYLRIPVMERLQSLMAMADEIR